MFEFPSHFTYSRFQRYLKKNLNSLVNRPILARHRIVKLYVGLFDQPFVNRKALNSHQNLTKQAKNRRLTATIRMLKIQMLQTASLMVMSTVTGHLSEQLTF